VVGYLGDFNGPDLRQHLAVNEAEIADVRARSLPDVTTI
jgi:hypothetical protein